MTDIKNFIPLDKWFSSNGLSVPLIVAGPCSAESEEQVLNTAKEIVKINAVNLFRAGVWKPRTKPGSFEGVGFGVDVHIDYDETLCGPFPGAPIFIFSH